MLMYLGVKTWLYGLLSVLLLFTAAIVSNIEAIQQTLNITLDAVYLHVFIPVEALIWIRSIAIVLLIVAHALRHVQLGKPQAPAVQQGQPAQPAQPFEITPELVTMLRSLIAEVTVTQVQQEPLQLTESTTATAIEDGAGRALPIDQLAALFPNVTVEEITAVVTAYQSGVQRREMCAHLKWGGQKYSSIVKPVLDAYEQLQQAA
jgi:hypothetical protein